MDHARIARIPGSMFLAAAVILAVAFTAAPATAATAAWSQQSPVPGAAVASRRPVVSVRLVGERPLYGPTASYLKVDGKTLRDVSIVYDAVPGGGVDMTKAVLSAVAHWDLADGVHRVDASVLDAGYVRHKTAWSFRVAAAPVVGSPQPGPGAMVSQAAPVVSAEVVDAGPIASVTVHVDGALVPSAFAGGVVTASPVAPLEDEATHSVRVAATDADGVVGELLWSFEVRTRPKMASVTECASCHVGYPVAHPVDDCAVCHGPASPVETGYSDKAESHGPGSACSECHGDLSACTDCHGRPYVTVPALHDLEDDSYHMTAVSSCQPCHARRLTIEHNRNGLTCLTCHTSSDAGVAAAILAGTTACQACHTGSSGHLLEHESTTQGCSDCHVANLVTEHVTDRSLTCDTCHASLDPTVSSAIVAGDTACDACHPAAGDHRGVHDSTIQAACDDCHESNLVGEHVDGRGLTCASCHESTDPGVLAAIGVGDVACGACHDFSAHPYVADVHVAQVAAMTISGTLRNASGVAFTFGDGTTATYAGQPCGQCHLMDLAAEHAKPTSSVAASECAACHASPRDTFADWGGTCQQGGCHLAYHGDMPGKHFQDFAGQEQGCGQATSGCHPGEWSGDLAALHDEAWYWGGVWADLTPYPHGCRICHSSPAAVPAEPANCQTCHTSRHGIAVFP